MNKNIKIFLNYVLGPLLFILLFYSIFKQIKQQPDLGAAWKHAKASFSSPVIINLVVVVFLVFINWCIEALKWRLAMHHLQPVSFSRAFKAIMSGVSFSVITPYRTGEYLGRALYVDEGKKIKTIALTMLGSLSQLLITVTAGIIGLIFIKEKYIATNLSNNLTSFWIRGILTGCIITLLILTVFYFRLKWLVLWVDKLPVMKPYAWLIEELENINATLLFRLLSLSLIRFIVFIIQYYLLFHFFGVEIGLWDCFASVSVIFLILAVIPGVALADLGIRGKVGIAVAGLYTANVLGTGLTMAGIWFLNLVLPAIIGSLLILSKRFFRKYK